jgi:L,D-transpeptidase catalytic domain
VSPVSAATRSRRRSVAIGATLATLASVALIVAALATPAAAIASARARGTATPQAGPPRAGGAWVADVVLPALAHGAPREDARTGTAVPSVAAWGTPSDLLVLEAKVGPEGREWLRVALDRRPNGYAVWIASADAVLRFDRWRIRVSRAAREVHVFRAGRLVRTFEAVVGKPSTPTPSGLFAIAAELRQPDPGEDFEGSWVLPLTAHSDVLHSFDGGDGQVALHGRGGASLLDPLGTALSHGCVRLANGDIGWIARHVPVGTPVRIA